MTTADTQQVATALSQNGAADGTITTTHTQADSIDTALADEIRRQIEYYFSDGNLATDPHLLKCCNGRENVPVSLSVICGFKKMRLLRAKRSRSQWKPQVASALHESAFLEVTEDGKKVKRKVPLRGACVFDPGFFGDKDQIFDVQKQKTIKKPVEPLQPISQDKTAYPEGTSKNMMKPTGFEQTYMEPPVRPEEAADEADIFGSDNLLSDRIRRAIQLFKEKRRMHEMYAHVFNKLMRFGGVEHTPRTGQGVTDEDLKGLSKREQLDLLATHRVPEDYDEEGKWAVDFDGLTKSFLSWYPAHYGYAHDTIKNASQVPRSFYNFLRFHRVCPEYDEQLVKALKTCDVAEQELSKVHKTGLALPGDFNKSASALFGGAHAGLYAGDKSWAEDMRKEGIQIDEIGICNEEARIKFGAGLAIMGSNEQAAFLNSLHLKALDIISVTLEVVEIQTPTDDTRALYHEQSKISEHKVGGRLEPLGRINCKTWHADDCDEWDLPLDKYPSGKPQQAETGRIFEFWLEESILEDCFVGLKIDGKVLTLESGITILDEVHETMCSFFTWLPNELCMDRKPRAVVWLPKGLAEDVQEPAAVLFKDGSENGQQERPCEGHKRAKGEIQIQVQGWGGDIREPHQGEGKDEGQDKNEEKGKDQGERDFSDDDDDDDDDDIVI